MYRWVDFVENVDLYRYTSSNLLDLPNRSLLTLKPGGGTSTSTKGPEERVKGVRPLTRGSEISVGGSTGTPLHCPSLLPGEPLLVGEEVDT